MSSGTFGHYRIVGPLGGGGMGTVHRAVHVDTGRAAALKTIRAPREEQLAGIRREISGLARLAHPGIVRILDHGVQMGVPWYAMELCEGTTMREHLEMLAGRRTAGSAESTIRTSPDGSEPTLPLTSAAGALHAAPEAGGMAPEDLPDVLTIVTRLCATLAYMHGEGVVHRDLKPENVLVREGGEPLLVDFGLMATLESDVGREALQATGDVVGTASYISPEQAQGALVDARSDLYSLGCILYEVLTGAPPFTGGNVGSVILRHVQEEPAPPSALVPWIPARLEALVLRLLAKDPRQRLGHAEDVAAALVELGARDGRGWGPPPRPYLYRSSFVGRDGPLASLKALLDRPGTERKGRLALLAGASGLGKTRMALELAAHAVSRGFLVLPGSCGPDAAALPLAAFRQPLLLLSDRCGERGTAEGQRLFAGRGKVLAALEPALARVPGLEDETEPLPLEGKAARQRLLQAVVGVLRTLSARERVLLVLDDIHFADELSCEALELLHRAAPAEGGALRLLATYRPEEASPHLQSVLSLDKVAHISLDPLEPAAIDSVVADMMAVERAPADLAAYLARHAEGNPFFVAEYLRSAVATGMLRRDRDGRWQPVAAAANLEDLPLPERLADVVGRRLEPLEPAARCLVDAAAVLGREASLPLLCAVSGLGEETALSALAELLARQLVEESSAREGVGYRLAHGKLAVVARDRLGPERRRLLHGAAAAAIEAAGASTGPLKAELGHHLEQAGDAVKARGLYREAALELSAASVLHEAARLYARCLALHGEADPERVDVAIDLGDVLRMLGRSDEAVRVLGGAHDEARKLGLREAEAGAAMALAIVGLRFGRLDEAEQLLRRALHLRRDLGLFTARPLRLLAQVLGDLGRVEEALAMYGQALEEVERIGDRRGRAILLGNVATIRHARGELAEAERLQRQALAVFEEIGDKLNQLALRGNLAVSIGESGRLDEAEGHLEQCLLVARELGLRIEEGEILGNLGQVHLLRGQLPEAMEDLLGAAAAARETGNAGSEGNALSSLATLERRAGRLDDAERHCRRAEKLLRGARHASFLGQFLCERGHLELALGRDPSAALQEAEAIARSIGAGPGAELGRAVERLRSAVNAAAVGRRLVHGDVEDDAPSREA